MNSWFASNFNKKLVRLMDLVCLSLLWLLFSLPIVTIGAASSALYYSYYKVFILNEEGLFTCFLRAFRLSFKQSTVAWLGYLLIIALYHFYVNKLIGVVPIFYYIKPSLSIVVVLAMTAFVIYLLAQIARFKQSLYHSFTNAVVLALAHLPQTLLMIFFLSIALLVVWLLPILVIITPAIVIKVFTMKMEKSFQPLLND